MSVAISQKEKSFVSVVVYLHNDAKYAKDFLIRANERLKKAFDQYEFILVDDASRDNTIAIAKETAASFDCATSIITMAWRQHLELAMLAGLDLAIGDFVIEIDSIRYAYPDDIFLSLFSERAKGFDIVGARPNGGQKLSVKIFYAIFRILLRNKMRVSTEPIRIVSRRALNAVFAAKEKNRYRKTLYQLSGFPFTHIVFNAQKNIKQHASFGDNVRLALSLFTSYTDLGVNLSVTLAGLFFVVALSGTVYAVLVYFLNKSVMPGWTTTFFLLSFGLSGIFLLMTIVFQYLGLILTESQRRPAYRVQSIDRIPPRYVPEKTNVAAQKKRQAIRKKVNRKASNR